MSIEDARELIEELRIEYNTEGPQSALGGLTPLTYSTEELPHLPPLLRWAVKAYSRAETEVMDNSLLAMPKVFEYIYHQVMPRT